MNWLQRLWFNFAPFLCRVLPHDKRMFSDQKGWYCGRCLTTGWDNQE